MFKKLFLMFGTFGKQNKALQIDKTMKFERLPRDVMQLDESYKQLIRELAKR